MTQLQEVKTESEEKTTEETPQQKDENNPENTLREVRGSDGVAAYPTHVLRVMLACYVSV